MKAALVFLLFVSAPIVSFAQDMQLRQEAVRLLERASAASMLPNPPNLERIVTFRVLDSSTGPQEGTFTRVVIQGTGRRDEATFGNYHLINVWAQRRLATVRTSEVIPPIVHDVMWLTPIRLGHFDREDVIFAISDSEANGRPARCVEFNTIAGDTTENNELCMDASNGTLVREKLGDMLIENSSFFPFAGALFPGKIAFTFAGIPKLEISQTMKVLQNPTPDVLAAPPDAQIRGLCKTFRRPFGQYMPQPQPRGGGEADIMLRGIIGKDGRVHDAVVQLSERPDLNAQALSLIRQWVFEPALCDGQPNDIQASFMLHFR
jgi:TonB family protein